MNSSIAIVGAGIAGSALAAHLVAAGQDVILIDPAPGSGASGNAWALLHSPAGNDLDARLLREALRSAQDQLHDLQPALAGADALLLGFEQGQILALAPASLLAQLRNGRNAPRLIRQLVRRIEPVRDGWLVHLDHPQAVLQCAQLVLANALDTAQLWPGLENLLRPVRGQVDAFVLHATPQAAAVLHSESGYAVSAGDGQWWVGASFQPDRCDLDCDPLDTQSNRARLAALLCVPEDQLQHQQGRASVRVVSPDRRPLVGPANAILRAWSRTGWPQVEPGLWLNLAHGAHGFTTAFLAAEMLTAQLLGRSTKIAPRLIQALHPGRFGRR